MSLDCEFSGIMKYDYNTVLDDQYSRFEKIKHYNKKYKIIQIGISCFKYCNFSCSYDIDVYNFYILKNKQHNIEFCSDTMRFLLDNNFDFNKLIKEGLSYTNEEEYKNIQNLKPELILSSSLVNEQLNENLRTMFLEITEILVTKDKDYTFSNVKKQYAITTLLDCIEINIFDNLLKYYFQRNLINYSKIFHSYQKSDKNIFFIKKIENNLGFTNVLLKLSKAGKTVVGHNMIIDIIKIIETFFVLKIDNYNHFKSLVKDIFPNLCDTKYVACMNKYKRNFKNTQLNDIYNSVKKLNYKITENGINQNIHNAGFDSFITGYIYTYFLTTSKGENIFNKIHMIKSNNFNYFDIDDSNEKNKNNYENMYILELKNNLDYALIYEILSDYLPISVESIKTTHPENSFLVRVDEHVKNSKMIKQFETIRLRNKQNVFIYKYNDFHIEIF